MQKDNLHLKFLTKAATLLHECGVSSHQLESTLSDISQKMNCHSSILISPTSISIGVTKDDHQLTNNLRITKSGIDFSKLSDVQDVIIKFRNDVLDLNSALSELNKIESTQSYYPIWLNSLAFGFNAIGLCVFFKIPYSNMPITFISGLLAGALFFKLIQNERWNRVALTIASFIPTLFLFTTAYFIPGVEIQNSIFASLIVLIPGLSLTVSMTELASSHLISGTARLMGALVDFFKISLGVLSAWKLGQFFNIKVSTIPEINYHFTLKFLSILICSVCLSILFNAKKKDFKWIVISSFLSLLTLEMTALLKNQNVAIFITSLCIGLYTNKCSKFFNRPVQILGLPALILLVPGSIALKGINLAAAHNLFGGVGQTINAFSLATMIVAGLFLADIIIPEKR